MTPEAMLRDDHARFAALQTYSKAHDRYAELEQRLVGQGKHIEAEGAHQMGLIALRAWLAENENPEPKEPA